MEPGLDGHRVLIAGGRGLVGRHLLRLLVERGRAGLVLSRAPTPQDALVPCLPWEELPAALPRCGAVVNLAGESLAGPRWTPERRRILRGSRLGPTRRLVEALEALEPERRPRVLINASAVGWYGDSSALLDESAPAGSGFLAELCRDWEAEASRARDLGLRVVLLRLGVVLSTEGGALPAMVRPIRAFLGAPLGHGRQGFSWIHAEDLARLILHALEAPALEGPVNATAPGALSSGAFSRLLARRLRRPLWPLPGFLSAGILRALLGPMAEEMLLQGAFARPRKALESGFGFRFPTAEAALEDLYPPLP